ncbi:protein of unknown function [Ralstonia solanacearum CMR15]|nr:protein of unknown function [Ralstonia solanacearum CMR15]
MERTYASGLVLFTDFDGVLHAADEPAVDGAGRLLANPNLFVWLPLLVDIWEPYPDVRIVVSTDRSTPAPTRLASFDYDAYLKSLKGLPVYRRPTASEENSAPITH